MTKTVLAARLKRRREELGWTQRQLGEKLEVRWTVVSRWEKMDTYPSIPSLVELCQVLRVSADWLIGLQDDRRK